MSDGTQATADAQDKKPLTVLLVEDNPDDAALCQRALKKSPTEIRCDAVKTRQEFTDRLRTGRYDLILSDYSLGDWTATDVFNILCGEKADTPLILVTGSLGDEKAVECIRNGMADYILKDRLDRLPLAISRAMEAKNARDDQRRAEHAVRQSEEKFRNLIEAIPAATFIEQNSKCIFVNRAAEDITGYTREELMGMTFSQLVHPENKDAVAEATAKSSKDSPVETAPTRYQIKILTRENEARWLDVTVGTIPHNDSSANLTTAFDITERKRAEQESAHLHDPLTGLASYQRMVEVYDAEVNRSDRTERPFSVVVLVLDGLKQLYEKHGHLVGSRALCRLARIMRLYSRMLDTAIRLGDDEFGFVLPETAQEGALVLARRIATRLADDNEEPRLSCRFNAVSYPQAGKALDEVLKAARRGVVHAPKPGGAPVGATR